MLFRALILPLISGFVFTSLLAVDLKLEYDSKLEQKFFADWQNNQTTNIDTLTAWLVADGMTDSSEIRRYKNDFETITTKIMAEVNPDDDPDEIARDIFKFLHKEIFNQVRDNAEFKDLFSDGSYNAITGSGLYYLLCRKFNVPIEIIATPFYASTRIVLEERNIDIEITDSKKGFDKKNNKKDLLQLLVELGVMEEEEYKNGNVDQLYEDYFGTDEPVNPYKLTGTLYHYEGLRLLELGNLEFALKYFEKAVIIDPEKEVYADNYKYVLYNLSDISVPYDKFLPYLENSLWLLNGDPAFVDVAILMSGKAIAFYADDHRDFEKALDLIFKFKTTFLYEKYTKFMNEYEEKINYDWSYTLYGRGEYDIAYKKMKILYSQSPLPKYKDAYVSMALKYAKALIFNQSDYDRAGQVIDSLYTEAPDYPVVEDAYIRTILVPIMQGGRYVVENPNSALTIAHRAFKIAPEHSLTKFAISRVYHEMAMEQIRKNNLLEAHKLLIRGLDYIPDDKLLNEDLVQLEDTF